MTSKKRSAPAKSAAVYAPLIGAKPVTVTTTPAAPKPPVARTPARYCYRLVQPTVERLPDGWWIIPDGRKRQGPYPTPQDVCVAIARDQCAELSNRHHALASSHGIGPGDPLFGLPDPPQLSAARKSVKAP